MQAVVAMSKEQRTSVNTGAIGEFLPLGMWKAKGLTDEQLSSLESKAPKRWCPLLLGDYTFQLMVQNSGHKDEEIVTNRTTYTASDSSAPPPAKRLKDDPALQRVKEDKALQKKLAVKVKMDIAQATKIVSLLAPLIAQGKMLMGGRLLQLGVSSRIPACVMEAASNCLRQLEIADASWKTVLSDGPPPSAKEVQIDASNDLKKTASKAFQALSSMLKLID